MSFTTTTNTKNPWLAQMEDQYKTCTIFFKAAIRARAQLRASGKTHSEEDQALYIKCRDKIAQLEKDIQCVRSVRIVYI